MKKGLNVLGERRYKIVYDAEFKKYMRLVKTMRRFKNKEEEDATIILAKNGDVDALEQIILRNFPFLLTIAQRYFTTGTLTSDDFLNQGIIGLVKAVKVYNVNVGVRFMSFAVHYIRKEISDFIGENNTTVKMPRWNQRWHGKNDVKELKRGIAKFAEYAKLYDKKEDTFSRYVVKGRVFQFLSNVHDTEDFVNLVNDYSEFKEYFIRGGVIQHESLNRKIFSDGEIGLDEPLELISHDVNDIDRDHDSFDRHGLVKAALSLLTPMERTVIIHTYGFDGNTPKSSYDIGRMLSITPVGVNRAKNRALNKLKKYDRLKDLC